MKLGFTCRYASAAIALFLMLFLATSTWLVACRLRYIDRRGVRAICIICFGTVSLSHAFVIDSRWSDSSTAGCHPHLPAHCHALPNFLPQRPPFLSSPLPRLISHVRRPQSDVLHLPLPSRIPRRPLHPNIEPSRYLQYGSVRRLESFRPQRRDTEIEEGWSVCGRCWNSAAG